MANIQPITIPIKGTATSLNLMVLNFNMNAKTAVFYYWLNDANGVTMVDGNIEMTEAEFAGWGADNQYCFEWASNKLGLTLINN